MNTNAQAGGPTDLLSSIMGVTVRNEEKIAAADREFCEARQEKLYAALRQLQWWYELFKANTERYREKYNVIYEENGSIDKCRLRSLYHNEGTEDYSAFEFLPFKAINGVVELYGKAVEAFAGDIVRHFNNKYGVSVPMPEIDDEKLPMGFLPTYLTYVDQVIAHLGGKGFRETAEEELIARFHESAIRCRDRVPELKGDRIVFNDVLWYENYSWQTGLHLSWNYAGKLDALCAGIVFGMTESLNGGSNYIVGYKRSDVDASRWYELITGAVSVKFFKNGRVDFKFGNADTAERCWKRLRLDTFKTPAGDE